MATSKVAFGLLDIEEVKLSKYQDTDIDEEDEMDDVSENASPRVDMSSTGATWELKTAGHWKAVNTLSQVVIPS